MDNEKKAIENYITSLQELHTLGILKSKHDFTSQFTMEREQLAVFRKAGI
jgi:D-mannonate dehydratase